MSTCHYRISKYDPALLDAFRNPTRASKGSTMPGARTRSIVRARGWCSISVRKSDIGQPNSRGGEQGDDTIE